MLTIVLRRLISLVFVMLGVSILTFAIVRLIPGDPATNLLGASATHEDVARINHELKLDRPLPVQYWTWLTHVVRGDLGNSVVTRQPVLDRVVDGFRNSLILASFSMTLACCFGLSMGCMAAVRRGTIWDRFATGVAVAGTSVPPYWLGLVLIYVFAVRLGWLPTGGRSSLTGGGVVDDVKHLILPGLTLALAASGTIARVTRTSLLEVLDKDYVRTARAKGVSEMRVLLSHALRNAMIPVINVAGLQIGFLLGSSIVIEQIFAWPGAGRLVFTSIAQRDYSTLQGAVLFTALAFVLANFLVDLISVYLDPRARFA